MRKPERYRKTSDARKIPLLRTLPFLFLLVCSPAVLAAPGQATPDPVPPSLQESSVGGKISGDVRVSGRIRVTEDLLVLAGATLTVAPGTVITFSKSESTKVEPEYFFGGTELVVRGTLRAKGARFLFPDRSGGIVVDGGTAHLADCIISGAEAGITLLRDGSVDAFGPVTVADCRTGVALFPATKGGWTGGGEITLAKNGVAAVRFPGAPPLPATFKARGSEEKDVLAWADGSHSATGKRPTGPVPSPGALRMGDTFLDRSRTLSGDVIIEGVIRVAPGATLSIAPGSRLFFGFRDTDGDGIGESGLFLQGNLNARGGVDRPIGFHPLDGGGWGRWDAINFMASETGENVLENVVIAGAYRGLHAHFSRLRGSGIRISGCYRGIQFQESDVELSGVEISSCQSALRCRDSDVRLAGLRVIDSVSGANFFRSRVELSSPEVSRSGWYGFRFRESRTNLSHGSIREGMVGFSVQEGTVHADNVAVESAGLAGIALLEGDVKINNCRISGSGVDAISATRGKAQVTGGALSAYGRYAVKLGGPAEVSMSGVAIAGSSGGGNPVYDGKVAPGLGVVRIE